MSWVFQNVKQIMWTSHDKLYKRKKKVSLSFMRHEDSTLVYFSNNERLI